MTLRLLALSLILVLPLSAQQRRAMTPDDVLAMKNVADAQISPDGKWVAYVVSVADMKESVNNTDVWLVPAAGGSPLRLTGSPKADNQPRWSPDGKTIAFISAREERPQIWLISPFGGEAEKLTESKSGVQSFQWSPDGSKIAYVAQREQTPEEERRVKEKDDAQEVDKNFRMTRIWVYDVAAKKATEIVKDELQVGDVQWSPDGSRLAYTATLTPKADDGSRADIYIVPAAGGTPRKLIENPGPDTGPRWSPDGRSIAYLSRNNDRQTTGQTTLRIIPAEGGTSREVLANFIYQPGAVTWFPDGRTLAFTSSVRTTFQLFTVPAAGGTPKQVSEIRGVMSPVTWSADRSVLAFTRADPQSPSDVHVSRGVAPFTPVKLTDHNPQVKELALGRSEVIKWQSSEGMEIEGVLIYPTDYQPGRKYPTMAFIHGGPSGVWTEGFPASWGNYAHVWAGKGWVSFFPNVRGSSGYGEKFQLSNVRDWGGGDYRDVQTGLDELVKRGIADPAKLGQSGWSYGGYMTAWTLTQTDRFKGVMVGAGLTNMYSMYSTNDLQTVLEEYFGGEPWNDEEAYRRASAMTYIKQAKTPTMIMHGAQDQRVPVGQAQELYMGLKKNGVPVELVFYPRQGHGIGEPRLQLDKMKREYAFFAKYVLGEAPVP
jgi:dipeptidyl aminopeptidase/acylaminoacyl peptidase